MACSSTKASARAGELCEVEPARPHTQKRALQLEVLIKRCRISVNSGTLNHDSYVYVHKYLGEAYFPVSVGAKK